MKKIFILALLVLTTAACSSRKTSDEVQRRIDEEKLSGEWDRRPEVALRNKLLYNPIGSCENKDLKFNAVSVDVLNAKPDYSLSITIYLKPDQTYRALLTWISVGANGNVFVIDSSMMIEGAWNTRTDYGVVLKGIGVAQFDDKMTTATVKLTDKEIKVFTEATEGRGFLMGVSADIDGKTDKELCN